METLKIFIFLLLIIAIIVLLCVKVPSHIRNSKIMYETNKRIGEHNVLARKTEMRKTMLIKKTLKSQNSALDTLREDSI